MSLINLGDISKPITVLLECIRDFTGWVAEPYQIKRLAKANAEAELLSAYAKNAIKIKNAKTNNEILDFYARAGHRLQKQEIYGQYNIDNIVCSALPNIKTDAKPQNIERDWFEHYFGKAKHISNEDMQSLWAKILAGEANKPGAFSKRTLDIVASLEKKHAEQFARLCRYCWKFHQLEPCIPKFSAHYFQEDIDFNILKHLEDVCLIKIIENGTYCFFDAPQEFLIKYFDQYVVIGGDKSNNNFPLGKVIFTSVGRELAPLCKMERSEDYFLYILKEWKDRGYSYRLTSNEIDKKDLIDELEISIRSSTSDFFL